MADVLRESAAQLDVSPDALAEAVNILQLSLEFSLVQMGECMSSSASETTRSSRAAERSSRSWRHTTG